MGGKMRRVRRAISRFSHYAATALFLLLLLVGIRSDVYPHTKVLEQRLEVLTAGKRFSVAAWEVQALTDKAAQLVRGSRRDEGDTALVREFFDVAGRIGALRAEAERLAAQKLHMSARASEIQAELKTLYAKRDALEDDAEDVLALQVTRALRENELYTRILGWNIIWPPVTSEFVDLPLLLVISPRERIERRVDYLLDPDLTVAEMEAIEDAVRDMGYSGLVTHIGGLATYPAMIPEIYGLGFVLDTMPHEWVHDFLAFYPLGWAYGTSHEMTTMNETTADIVGEEIGQYLARRYYPEYVREPQPSPTPAPKPSEPPAFSFGAFMRETRLRTDELLAQGRVDEAEAYMEQRRLELQEHGYYIRKLNQAYFAFHGSYATGPGSVDPIGPQLQKLRAASVSLREFLFTVARMRSYDDLVRVVGTPEPTPTPAATPAVP
ncbi:MAG: hypothetical protein QHH80_01065 [Anaerolineae bacterium]|nr:hypothetical protein [Anaerolineae bacterium]